MESTMKRSVKLVVLAVLVLGTLALQIGGASPGELRVPEDYETIQAAIDEAEEGGIITIAPRTYQENLRIYDKEALTLQGSGAEPGEVIIESPTSGLPTVKLTSGARGITLINLTIRGGRRGIEVKESEELTIVNLIVEKSGEGIYLEGARGVEVSESRVAQNEESGIFILASSMITFAENEIEGNGRHGAEIINSDRDILFMRNVISNNQAHGIDLTNAVAILKENVLKGNGGCGLSVDEESNTTSGSGNAAAHNGSGNLCGELLSDIWEHVPPPAPLNLLISPSEWTNQPHFEVDWDNPEDPSEIVAAWYKIGGEPRGPEDGIRTESKPITIENPLEGRQPVYVWLEDGVCNKSHENRNQIALLFDETPPTIKGKQKPQRNANGWNNEDVTVTFECKDEPSGIVSCTEPVTLTQEGEAQVVPGQTVDKAGNRAQTTVKVSIDKTKPIIQVGEPQGQLGQEGWYRSDVTVPYTAQDNLSGFTNGRLSTEGSARTSGEGAELTALIRVSDLADNEAEVTVGPFKVDKTSPTITAQPRRPPDANGWYNRDVTVDFKCDDRLSGLASCTPETPVTVSKEGRDQVIQGEAMDKAGNRATATAKISLDRTPPISSLVINEGAPTTSSHVVTLKIQAHDNLSGVEKMRFSNDGRSWSKWERFEETKKGWDLFAYGGNEQEGSKTVWVQVKDKAGNISEPFGASIILDFTTLRIPGEFKTIQAAIEAASEGYSIIVGPGTYEENLIITKSIYLRGAGRERTTIKAVEKGKPVVLIKKDRVIEVTIEGMTIANAKAGAPRTYEEDGVRVGGNARVLIQNSQLSGNYGDGLSVLAAEVTIHNSQISGNKSAGLYVGDSGKVTISNCQISGNRFDGLSIFAGYGNLAKATIESSQISENGFNGLDLFGPVEVEVRGSTIDANGTASSCYLTPPQASCDGINLCSDCHMIIMDAKITNNAGWGVEVCLKKCGFGTNSFTGEVIFKGQNVIEGNNKAGHHEGEVCLP